MAASSDFSRRRFLAGVAAAGSYAALPAGAGAVGNERGGRRRRRHADVLIVGAGLAGLSAANEVVAAGRSAIVLEARARVGGRTLNHGIGGGRVVELGGQWIGPTQGHLAALANDLGVKTFKTYNEGDYIYLRNGTRIPYQQDPVFGAVPPSPTGVADAFSAILKINDMASELDVARPWQHPNALKYDSQTFATWLDDNSTTPDGRFLLELGITSVWACEPRDVSLLHVLAYIRGATDENSPVDFQRLINTAGGAQDSRFVGGSQKVSIRLAKRLEKRVILRSAVRRLIQERGQVRAICGDATYTGKQVIVTAPPAVTAYIDYEPALPADRAQLLQRFPQGSCIKCHAVYDKPFWRDAGLAGQVTSDADPVRVTFDNSPPDASKGVLLAFIEGHAARAWARRSAKERQAAVLANLTTYFGDAAARPNDYFEQDWSQEQWTRGCFEGYMPPGVLTEYGEAIRRPFKRIHWAGSEAATYWNGYMDGAVRSGERAAAETLSD